MTAPHCFARLLLVSVLTGVLAACQSLSPASVAAPTVSGTIIFPPTAGQAIFSAAVDGQTLDVARASVAVGGGYTLTLPTPTALPVQGNAQGLVGEFLNLPREFSSVNCVGGTQISDPAARLVTLNAGRFEVAGAVTGHLIPAQGVVADRLSALGYTVTQRTYTYADRAVHVSGTLNCTLTRPDGTQVAGVVQVKYQLACGWNTIENRTEQTTASAPLSITLTTKTLGSVDWRYQPAR